MTTEGLRGFFLRCAVYNGIILLTWSGVFILGRDWMHRIHSRWFRLQPERFDELHYAGLAAYKVLILVLNVVPYLALLTLR